MMKKRFFPSHGKRYPVKRIGALMLSLGLLGLSLSLLMIPLFFYHASVHAQKAIASDTGPNLQALEQVTNNAFGDGSTYVPNSWGVHKSRIVRTSTGDLFMTYISAGTDVHNRTWHLMHKAPGGSWQDIKQGNAGAEPINILLGPGDTIHLFAWPGTNGQLDHLVSTNLGQTFTDENVPGQWTTSQGYSGAAINPDGNMVVFQTGNDTPGMIFWAYYTASSHSWQFHSTQIDQFRYTYNFVFVGDNNDLTFVGMRDVQPGELGISYPTSYIFNKVAYFYIPNVNNPVSSTVPIREVQPNPNDQNHQDFTYVNDVYVDTQGRVHVLYESYYEGLRHAIIQNGAVVKDVLLSGISLYTQTYNGVTGHPENKTRIIQDAQGRFYLIHINPQGRLEVYPGAANDTDGTQFDPVVTLNNSQLPGCSDTDFCHGPTLTAPRSGNALSNVIDGVYGNHTQEIYFRIQLTPTVTPTPTPTPTLTSTPTPTPTPPPSGTLYRTSFEDGTTQGWSGDAVTGLSNSTTEAFDGSHSLALTVNSVTTNTHPLLHIDSWQAGSPPMPVVGQTITAEVFVPSGSPAAKAAMLVEDSNSVDSFLPWSQVPLLQPGQWNYISYTIPSSISAPVVSYGVGFNFPSSSSSSLTAYVDAITWTRYSFEDATADGWNGDGIDSIANSTTVAYDGSHSLALTVNAVSPNTHPLLHLDSWQTGNPAMPAAGQTVAAWVYVPVGSPTVKAGVVVEDSSSTQHFIPFDQVQPLQQGVWQQVAYTVPSSISVVSYGIGFNFPATSSQSLVVSVDSINF